MNNLIKKHIIKRINDRIEEFILVLLFLFFLILLLVYLHNYSLNQITLREGFFKKIGSAFKKAGKAIEKTGKKAINETKELGEKAERETKELAEKAAKEAQKALEILNFNKAIKEFKNGIKQTIKSFENIEVVVDDIKYNSKSYINSIKNIPKSFDKLSDIKL